MKVVTRRVYYCVLVLLICSDYCLCVPASNVELIASMSETKDKSYSFSYTLSDGQKREETGVLTRVGETEVYKVTGSYEFKGTDGKLHIVQYNADENGYHADVIVVEAGGLFDDRIDPTLLKTLVGG